MFDDIPTWQLTRGDHQELQTCHVGNISQLATRQVGEGFDNSLAAVNATVHPIQIQIPDVIVGPALSQQFDPLMTSLRHRSTPDTAISRHCQFHDELHAGCITSIASSEAILGVHSLN